MPLPILVQPYTNHITLDHDFQIYINHTSFDHDLNKFKLYCLRMPSHKFQLSCPHSPSLPGDYNLNKYECKLSEDPFKTSISFSGQNDFENIFINANKFSTIHNCLPPYILTNLITLHISRNVVSLVVSWMQHFFFEVVNLINPVKMKRGGT